MNGQMNWRERYQKSLSSMHGPYKPSDIPNVSLDLRGMCKYAKENGKNIVDLNDDELQPFVLNCTVKEMRERSISISSCT